MTIYTIGFTKKSAETFFGLLSANSVQIVLDIRLNNSSQLAGFTKGRDLEYFLRSICRCDYRYETVFAPTKTLMDHIKAGKITLKQFEESYSLLMEEREALPYFEERYAKADNVCLLCSEDTPKQCHRRVLAGLLASGRADRTVRHL